MGAKYSGMVSATNTASTTVPSWALAGGTGGRIRLYHWIIGSPATPGNQAADFAIRRQSARGTSNAAFVGNPLDPADVAALGLFDTGWAVAPTITANSDLLNIAMNQQATAQWMVDPSNGIVIPATSGAGLSAMSVATTSAAAFRHSSFWEE